MNVSHCIYDPAENIHNGKIYIHNNVWKFRGDHILIKLYFDIQKKKNLKKTRREPASSRADKQMNTLLRSI